MIKLNERQYFLSDRRVADFMRIIDEDAQLQALYLNLGLLRQHKTLLKGVDYRNFYKEQAPVSTWIRKRIWQPGKNIRIDKSRTKVIHPLKEYEPEILDKIAAEFSKNAVRGLAFVRGDIAPRPLADALAEKAHARSLAEKAEKNAMYSEDEGSGLF